MKNIIKYSNKGHVMMLATIFFLVVSLTVIFGLSEPIVRQKRITTDALQSRQSYFLAEGGVEDAILRLKSGMEVLPVETLTLNGVSATITTSDTDDGKTILAEGDVNDLVRRVETTLMLGSGVSFHYGMQAGQGGIILQNSSSVVGSVYSSGSVTGTGPTNNFIRGDVISAGPNGLVRNLHATSSVFANTIDRVTIDKNAYYNTITGSTVLGTQYPGSVDQPELPMPISDEQIEEWKAEALSGGIISSPCPYKITNTTTIGPKKIACDLEISGNNLTVTIAGNIWVEGNIEIKNGPTIAIDPSLGNKGVAIVADKPSNRLTSSQISVVNTTKFTGSGSSRSYVFLVSQNNSAKNGGAQTAITIANTVSGDVLVYAGHGELRLSNSVNLREATAYLIRLQNTAKVEYKTGLVNLLFSSGPSGGYEILKWKEIQ
jgi:hypothetical protein